MTTYDIEVHKRNILSRIQDVGVEIKNLKSSTSSSVKDSLLAELAAYRAELNELEVDQGKQVFEHQSEAST